MFRHLLTAQAYKHFAVMYEAEIGDPEEIQIFAEFETDATVTGRCVGFVLTNGLCVVTWNDTDRWSLYETRERVEAREYDEEWLEYYKTKGHWTRKIPEKAGVYATRNLDGIDCADRVFETQIIGDKFVVRDTTGFCPAHKRTEWAAFFWSLPRPKLRSRTELGAGDE